MRENVRKNLERLLFSLINQVDIEKDIRFF